MNTPMQTALNEAIRRGVPIGGTSAGLAVLGEYVYTAQGDKPDDPNLDGKTAMADPYGARINLTRGFLDIPILKGIVADTHFARRDRMGRLLVFLARLNQPDGKTLPGDSIPVKGIGIEERAAVLLERVAYRPLRQHGASRLAALISAIGASIFLQELFALIVIPDVFHRPQQGGREGRRNSFRISWLRPQTICGPNGPCRRRLPDSPSLVTKISLDVDFMEPFRFSLHCAA